MGTHELAVVGLVGSGVGAVLGTPLVWAGHRRVDMRVLGAALLLASAVAAVISARLAGLLPASAVVAHTVNGLGLVAFPLAVAYVRLATGAARPFHPALGWPLAAYVVVATARGAFAGTSDIPFAWLLPVVLGFTAAAAARVGRHPGTRTGFVPPAGVVGFMALLNVAQVARMDLGHLPAVRAVVPLVVVAGFVALAAFVTWRQAIAGVPAPATPAEGTRHDGAAGDDRCDGAPAPRYARSALDETAAADLRARIDRALDEDRLFARPDLTLATLATAAGTTPHLVSEALNRYGAISFRDLVTRRRVDDVKAQLAAQDSERYTIEGIGLAAGFRSRTALYDAFRRLEGTTPTAYRDAASRHRDDHLG